MTAMETQNLDYKTVLDIVRGWPATQRFMLVQAVLQTLAPEPEQSHVRLPTMELARGLLATGKPPPSDEEVKRWLEEKRLKKYG